MTEWKMLAGKRCLVTGGSSGIGLALVRLFHDEGAQVMTCARGEARLQAAIAAIGQGSRRLHGVRADVGKLPDLDLLFDAVDRTLGGLDILVANAGIAGEGVDMADDEIDCVLTSNLFGQIACVRRGAARMKEGGRIVMIGSMSADVREEEGSVYVASKAGLQGFAAALRKAFNKCGLHVHLVEPGAVATPLHGLNADELQTRRGKGEMLTTEEIAECVAFILTRSSICDIVGLQVRPHKQFI